MIRTFGLDPGDSGFAEADVESFRDKG
jgi:ATP-dependent Clp protease adaptor protein ClpS